MPQWRIRATIEDSPGRLSALAGRLAALDVNILSMQVHPSGDDAVDELVVAAPAGVGVDDLACAVRQGGGRDAQISPAQLVSLGDGQTRAITLAGRLADDIGDLPWVLIDLLGDCSVSWQPEEIEADSLDGPTMWLRDPEYGRLVISRPATPFTPTEFARARATVDLAARLARVSAAAGSTLAILVDGQRVTLRRARRDDLEPIADMHARCSSESLYRRYLVGTPAVPRAQLERLLTPERGHALVAEANGRPVALANLMWDGTEAEIAVLVEDAWQRRGLGTLLLRRLVAVARSAGITTVYALTLADNIPMTRTMARLDLPIECDEADGVLTLTARLGYPRSDQLSCDAGPTPRPTTAGVERAC
jgi:N-acetylglutamate synthase-like GNAT family acetyltransferase